jgi:hypothetical protein
MDYKLKPPNSQTIKRLYEIEFYLSFKHISDLGYGQKWKAGAEFIKSIANLCEVDHYTLLIPYGKLLDYNTKPSRKEIIIFLNYYGVPYRDIYKIFGIHSNTVRKYLREYIDEGEPPLSPKLPQGVFDELLVAIDVLHKTLSPIIMGCSLIERGIEIRKNLEDKHNGI